MKRCLLLSPRFFWLPAVVVILLTGCPSGRKQTPDSGNKPVAQAEVTWRDYESKENGFGFKHPDLWAVEVTPRETATGRYCRVQFTLDEPGDGDRHVMDMMIADKRQYSGTVEENFQRIHRRPFVPAPNLKKLTTKAGYTAIVFYDDSQTVKYDYALVDCGAKVILIDSAFGHSRQHLERVIDEIRCY